MIELCVTEICLITYKHLRYFKFDLDAGKDFCYRSRVSHNAFFHVLYKDRNYAPTKDKATAKILYHTQYCDHKESHIKFLTELLGENPYKDIPIIELESIWKFYEEIGYDYKKQRYNQHSSQEAAQSSGAAHHETESRKTP